MSYLVMDIETIPDLTLWQPPAKEPERLKVDKKPSKNDVVLLQEVVRLVRAGELNQISRLDLEKAHDIATRLDDTVVVNELAPHVPAPEPEKDAIAPIPAQQPIVIGCLAFSKDFQPGNLGVIGRGTLANNEVELLTAWNNYMGDQHPTLVTWNGRGFDLPVLFARSYTKGTPAPWYYAEKNYRYRYSDEKHLDLMDVMTDYGSAMRNGFRLDTFAKAIGLPGKYGIDGSQVAGMHREGRIAEIETYCLTDVIQTGFVFLRYMYTRGKMNIVGYRKSCNDLLEKCLIEPRFSDFCKLIDRQALTLEKS